MLVVWEWGASDQVPSFCQAQKMGPRDQTALAEGGGGLREDWSISDPPHQ